MGSKKVVVRKGRVKLSSSMLAKDRSDRVTRNDVLSGKGYWVHNGREYHQVTPVRKDMLGRSYGMFVATTRMPKHPKKKVKLPGKKK
jgi:ribosomal protein S19